MISAETRAEIKRLYHAEHLTCNSVAKHLKIHHLTVRNVLRQDLLVDTKNKPQPRLIDPYIEFIEERLWTYPGLRATRLLQMLRDRGFEGSLRTLRRNLAAIRPQTRKAFLPVTSFIGDEAQVDWAHFGVIRVGKAERRLSCFAMVLAYSRALFATFCLDQTLESFLRSHMEAFTYFGGVARRVRYDNLKAAVIERHGSAVRFNESLLEFSGHYCYEPSACNPYSGHEKGKVERNIRYIRDNFFAGRSFSSLDDANRQMQKWLEEIANQRPWPQDNTKRNADVWKEEVTRLIPLPKHPFSVLERRIVRTAKTPFIRFDLNDYSVPYQLVHKPLTLLADTKRIRIVHGQDVVAEHDRSYSKGERITNRVHFEGLYERRPGAHVVASREYLSSSIKPAGDFFALMVDQGETIAPAAVKLTELYQQYGAKILTKAVDQALERKIGRYAYVARVCHQIEKSHVNLRPPPKVDLSSHPELEAFDVKQHDLSTYDKLHNKDE
jgi:transposase